MDLLALLWAFRASLTDKGIITPRPLRLEQMSFKSVFGWEENVHSVWYCWWMFSINPRAEFILRCRRRCEQSLLQVIKVRLQERESKQGHWAQRVMKGSARQGAPSLCSDSKSLAHYSCDYYRSIQPSQRYLWSHIRNAASLAFACCHVLWCFCDLRAEVSVLHREEESERYDWERKWCVWRYRCVGARSSVCDFTWGGFGPRESITEQHFVSVALLKLKRLKWALSYVSFKAEHLHKCKNNDLVFLNTSVEKSIWEIEISDFWLQNLLSWCNSLKISLNIYLCRNKIIILKDKLNK